MIFPMHDIFPQLPHSTAPSALEPGRNFGGIFWRLKLHPGRDFLGIMDDEPCYIPRKEPA